MVLGVGYLTCPISRTMFDVSLTITGTGCVGKMVSGPEGLLPWSQKSGSV